MRTILVIAALIAVASGSIPQAVQAIELRVPKYDPYSPSTPNLYRRQGPGRGCQLPPSVQGEPAAPGEFPGWIFPRLIWGECPLRMPQPIRTRDNPSSPFGSTWR